MEYASIVYSSGRDLLLLINEILELAKVESKTIVISNERINLRDIAAFVKRNFDPIAQQKSLQFTIKIDDSSPQAIYSDQQRLLQILQNLLSNAFKFTEQGSVTFSISSDQHRVEFTIIDTGIGIERDKQEIIFDAFIQADGTTSRKYGGTGLGLSISKEFAILLGGELKLQSTFGEGSAFTLSIPLGIAEIEPLSPTPLNFMNHEQKITEHK